MANILLETKNFRKMFFYIILCCLPTFLVLSILILKTPFFIRTDEKRWFEIALSILSFKYECDGHVCIWHPPMYPASISLFFLLFGIGIHQARFTTVFYTMLYLVLTYFFVKEINGIEENSKEIIATLLFGTLPGILLFGFMIYSNIAEAFFIAGSLYFFIKAVNARKERYFLLCGAFLSLGVATKTIAFQALVYILVYVILTKNFNILKNRWFLAGIFLVFLTFTLWLVWIALSGVIDNYVDFWLWRVSILFGGGAKKNTDILNATPIEIYALTKVSPFAYLIWIPMLIGIGITVLTLVGVYFALKNRYNLNQGRILLLIWICIFLITFSVFGIRAARHALPILIPLIMFAVDGLYKINSNKKVTIVILFLVILTNIIQFFVILPFLLIFY